MDRRKFLAAMAAGAVITAEGLWMPGSKLISIPEKTSRIFEIVGPKIIITGNYPSPIWPGIEKWFYEKYKLEAANREKLFASTQW